MAPADLGGAVFRDDNANGVRDAGEVGIAGVPVTLTGTDDLGVAVARTSTTAADGSYHFTLLRPASYTVSTPAPGYPYLDGPETVGTVNGVVTGSAAVANVISGIALPAGGTGAGYLFAQGAYRGALYGSVYADDDNDGVRSSGEPGVPDVLITLTGTDDRGAAVSATLTTDAGGYYFFRDLLPGTYTLAETQPPLGVDGKETVGYLGGDASVNDVISGIVMTPAQYGYNYLFGERHPPATPGSLAGAVYRDDNRSGFREAGELGVAAHRTAVRHRQPGHVRSTATSPRRPTAATRSPACTPAPTPCTRTRAARTTPAR